MGDGRRTGVDDRASSGGSDLVFLAIRSVIRTRAVDRLVQSLVPLFAVFLCPATLSIVQAGDTERVHRLRPVASVRIRVIASRSRGPYFRF